MVRWFIDRKNKIPLYLQLRDLIEYYISTGALKDDQQLPTVEELARDLDINFETVRKTYKELEREQLIVSIRGRGTFVKAHAGRSARSRRQARIKDDSEAMLRSCLEQLLVQHGTARSVLEHVENVLTEVATPSSHAVVIFTECNLLQVRDISLHLERQVDVPVRAVLLEEVKAEIKRCLDRHEEVLAVITTGFHVHQVREMLKSEPVEVDFVITNMSPETRRRIDNFDRSARFGFVCRDASSAALYKDLLRNELGLENDLRCCKAEDSIALADMLGTVDVLLVSPTVMEAVRKLAPASLPIFNVFDRVDPVSLAVLKNRISAALARRPNHVQPAAAL